MKVSNRLRCGAAALFTAVGFALAVVQNLPAAADAKLVDDLWYLRDYEDGTVSVACEDKTVTELVVPSVIDGKTITMLEVDGFKDCTALEKITVPETVTVIEDYCFYNCTALKEINLPKNLDNIGFQAFCGCKSLESLSIPASVSEIEAFAFEGCASLTGVKVDRDNPNYKDENGILFDKNGETLYLYPSALQGEQYAVPDGCKTVYDNAFIGNPYLKNVDISGISELGEDAFYYCTSLETMTVPEGITELNGSVFGKCAALQSVSLPSTLETIGDSCFLGCYALDHIEIPKSVTAIQSYAFFNCPALRSITLTESVTDVGKFALGFYLGEDDKPRRMPEFEVIADNGTAAFDYCVQNSIKCSGGVTQGVVFVYIVVGVVAAVIIATVVIVMIQRKNRKKYEIY